MKNILIILVLMLVSMSCFASNTYDVTSDYDIPAVFKGCSIYQMTGGFMQYPMVAMYCPNKNVSSASGRVGKTEVGMEVVSDKEQVIEAVLIDKNTNKLQNITCKAINGIYICTEDK